VRRGAQSSSASSRTASWRAILAGEKNAIGAVVRPETSVAAGGRVAAGDCGSAGAGCRLAAGSCDAAIAGAAVSAALVAAVGVGPAATWLGSEPAGPPSVRR